MQKTQTVEAVTSGYIVKTGNEIFRNNKDKVDYLLILCSINCLNKSTAKIST